MTSRRMVLTGAVMAPLLGIFGQWQAHADQRATYRIIDGWGQTRLTPEAMTALRGIGARVYAIEPAMLVDDPNGPAIRMPLDSGAFSQDFTEGLGAIAGGLGLRTAASDHRVMKMSGSLRGTSGKGSLTLNEGALEFGPLSTDIRKDAVITVEHGLPGRPSLVKVKAPLHATPEALGLFTRHFDVSVFTPNMKIAELSGHCRFLLSS